MIGMNSFIPFVDLQKKTPKNNGYWTGERGNSWFCSYNPRMKKYGAECVEYKNGEPDFTRFCICIIEIESMSVERLPYSRFYKSNYEQAYTKLSNILSIRESEVKKWLKRNRFTLHESLDMKTIYVIPTEIHKTYIHAGGVAECKAILEDEEDDWIIELVARFGRGRCIPF